MVSASDASTPPGRGCGERDAPIGSHEHGLLRWLRGPSPARRTRRPSPCAKPARGSHAERRPGRRNFGAARAGRGRPARRRRGALRRRSQLGPAHRRPGADRTARSRRSATARAPRIAGARLDRALGGYAHCRLPEGRNRARRYAVNLQEMRHGKQQRNKQGGTGFAAHSSSGGGQQVSPSTGRARAAVARREAPGASRQGGQQGRRGRSGPAVAVRRDGPAGPERLQQRHQRRLERQLRQGRSARPARCRWQGPGSAGRTFRPAGPGLRSGRPPSGSGGQTASPASRPGRPVRSSSGRATGTRRFRACGTQRGRDPACRASVAVGRQWRQGVAGVGILGRAAVRALPEGPADPDGEHEGDALDHHPLPSAERTSLATVPARATALRSSSSVQPSRCVQ